MIKKIVLSAFVFIGVSFIASAEMRDNLIDEVSSAKLDTTASAVMTETIASPGLSERTCFTNVSFGSNSLYTFSLVDLKDGATFYHVAPSSGTIFANTWDLNPMCQPNTNSAVQVIINGGSGKKFFNYTIYSSFR